MSAFWLAESMPINPKQCKKLKFFECRKTKLVQKVEIKNDGRVPRKTVTKQTQNHLQKHAEDVGDHSEKLF